MEWPGKMNFWFTTKIVVQKSKVQELREFVYLLSIRVAHSLRFNSEALAVGWPTTCMPLSRHPGVTRSVGRCAVNGSTQLDSIVDLKLQTSAKHNMYIHILVVYVCILLNCIWHVALEGAVSCR